MTTKERYCMSIDWIKEAEKKQQKKDNAVKIEEISENRIINENHHDLKPFIKDSY